MAKGDGTDNAIGVKASQQTSPPDVHQKVRSPEEITKHALNPTDGNAVASATTTAATASSTSKSSAASALDAINGGMLCAVILLAAVMLMLGIEQSTEKFGTSEPEA